MKSIDTKSLTDEQYEDLSNLIENRLTIYDQMEMQADYDVSDLKVDDNEVIYAPTSAFTYENADNSADVPPNGISEMFTDLKGYEPIYTILKQQ